MAACSSVSTISLAELNRLGRTKQITAELRLVPAIAGQRQTRRDPDRTLGGGTSAADFLCQRGQRQQVVVFVDGFVALNRLPSGSANKKMLTVIEILPVFATVFCICFLISKTH